MRKVTLSSWETEAAYNDNSVLDIVGKRLQRLLGEPFSVKRWTGEICIKYLQELKEPFLPEGKWLEMLYDMFQFWTVTRIEIWQSDGCGQFKPTTLLLVEKSNDMTLRPVERRPYTWDDIQLERDEKLTARWLQP